MCNNSTSKRFSIVLAENECGQFNELPTGITDKLQLQKIPICTATNNLVILRGGARHLTNEGFAHKKGDSSTITGKWSRSTQWL